jgi:hypothetical protein
VPSEDAIQAGFKRGLTLNEILRGNPALRAWRKANPHKFELAAMRACDDSYPRQKRGETAKAWRARLAKGNPASGAAEVFEEFHGFPPSEAVTVTKKLHYHQAHLAARGHADVHLDVWGVDGQGHQISGFQEGAILACNETRRISFSSRAGDQSA